jgi:hypothetical protein
MNGQLLDKNFLFYRICQAAQTRATQPRPNGKNQGTFALKPAKSATQK